MAWLLLPLLVPIVMRPHEQLLSFTNASACIASADLPVIHALCECSKEFLHQNGVQFIHDRLRAAILVSTSFDGTPIITRERFVSGSGDKKVSRGGGSCHEFLVIRTYIADRLGDNTLIFKEPVDMSAGKKQWHLWSACRQAFGIAREHGHLGLCVSHYVWDRGIFSCMSELMRKTHRLVAKNMFAVGYEDPIDRVAGLLDLVVTTPCACHDAHNALRWAVSSSLAEGDEDATMSDLFICIASLRNAYDLLVREMPAWLMKVVTFGEDSMPCGHLVWTALGVESTWVDQLLELKLFWQDGQLHISRSLMDDPDMTEKITSSLLYLWKFVSFSQGRWLTTGSSSKALMRAILSGIDSLVSHIRASPHCSDYYIHGWARMSDAMRLFVGVTSMASYVPDAFLAATLEDDRVVKHLSSMEECVNEEVGYLCQLPDSVWDVLASACRSTSRQLRSSTIQAAHLASGFLNTRVFEAAKQPPWSLCHGDRRANLLRLRDLPDMPGEATTAKLWKLLRLGYNMDVLLDGLELMACCSWSTKVTEQGHVQASCLRKLHSQYGSETLVTRAMLGSMKPLLASTPQEQLLKKLVHRLSQKVRYKPSHIGPRQAYVKDLVEVSTEMKRRGRIMASTVQHTIFKQHNSMWQKTNQQVKARYVYLADQMRERRSQEQLGDVQHLRDRIVLEKSRLASEAHTSDGPSQVGCCRLTSLQREEFDKLYEAQFVSMARVAKLRAAAQEPPLPPAVAMQEALHACADPPLPSGVQRPPWWGPVCRARDVFRSSVWRFSFGEEAVYLKYVYATVSPLYVCFQSLTLQDQQEHLQEPAADWEEVLLHSWQHSFVVRPMEFVSLQGMATFVGHTVHVLRGCVHLGDILASDSTWERLEDILGWLPDVGGASEKVFISLVVVMDLPRVSSPMQKRPVIF